MSERPVRHPRLPPGRGQHPAAALLTGAARVGVFGLLAYVGAQISAGEVGEDLPERVELIAGVVALVLLGFVVHGAVLVVLGVLDLLTPRGEVEGPVVQKRVRATADWLPGWMQSLWFRGMDRHQTGLTRQQTRRRRRFIAVDDGGTGPIDAFRVDQRLMGTVQVGDVVRARPSRWLGHVKELEVIGVTPEAAEQRERADARHDAGVDRVVDSFAGLIDSAAEHLRAAGVDDEELRRRLEEGREAARRRPPEGT